MTVRDGQVEKIEASASPVASKLFGPGPKRVLGLDGGGVRGAISLAYLERLEALLGERHGRPVRLCEYFDLIGGTSTGSIIAAGLALGYAAAEMRTLYLDLAHSVFRRSRLRLLGVQAKFDAQNLRNELTRIIGDRPLDSPDLKTGLAIVMKRIDTGSPWVVSNNSRSAYWADALDGSYIGNHRFPIANLVRASAAAPYFFDPELLPIVSGAAPGLFLDGAVTPFNNPTLQLFLLVTLNCYGLSWPTGADRLFLCSVGTGRFRNPAGGAAWRRTPASALAVQALSGLIADTQNLSLTLLHALSGSQAAWPINGELGRLEGQEPIGGAPMFSFRRLDVELEAPWLAEQLGVTVTPAELARLRRLDEPSSARAAYELGCKAAETFLSLADLPPAFDLPPEPSA